MSRQKKTSLWESSDEKMDMRTTTQLMLEEGAKPHHTVCLIERKLVNFQSFNMDDPRYGTIVVEDEMEPPLLTNYMRQFSPPYPMVSKPRPSESETNVSPDALFNRKPKNDFDPQTGLDFKFLDEHMNNVTEERKKINFFRQLRNQSFFNY
ncbi:uncharacterized protein LOC6643509 [Drosophila willistoni]|nr:uncharacterized protein LOC6643509 [Drosophila willistoni]